MRKNNLYIGLLLLSTLFYAGCNGFLDEMPDNRTELNTEQSIISILVSAYPQSTNTLIGEFYSDNIDENSRSYSYWQKLEDDLYHWKDTYEENQDSPQAVWDDCYAAIASANNALNAIENLGSSQKLLHLP